MFTPKYRFTKYLSSCLEQTVSLSPVLKRLSLNKPLKVSLTRDAFNQDVHSSTWIEGNLLSLAQVATIASGKDILAKSKQKQEVKNCIKALRWVLAHKKMPLTTSRILALHSMMTQGLLDVKRCGHYRKVQNYIVNARRTVIFTPPSPASVPRRMKDLLTWFKASESEHALVRSAIFHHAFVAIHPFVDGNGRLARILSQWILLQGGYEPAHSFGLDGFFANDRVRYYTMIRETHDMDDDYTHWIEYVAEGLLGSMERLRDQSRSAKGGLQEWTPKQKEFLALLKKGGILGSAELCRALNVTRARVNQLVTPLIASGAVIKEGRTRAARYRAK